MAKAIHELTVFTPVNSSILAESVKAKITNRPLFLTVPVKITIFEYLIT
jgi:hypothetical protein